MTESIEMKIANLLVGMEYPDEINPATIDLAKKNGVAIVFGASDDLIEFRGAINDEYGSYGGAEIKLDHTGIIVNECSDRDCPCYHKRMAEARSFIRAVWARDNISWQYESNIPYETFDIMEDGEVYCRGIVFKMESIE